MHTAVFEFMSAIGFGLGEALTLLGLFGGLVAFRVGLVQYRAGQTWTRLQFVATELSEWERNRNIRNVLLMLDWNARRIFFEEGSGYGLTDAVVRDAEVVSALTEKVRYEPLDVAIRDHFDEFFGRLERLESFVASGAVLAADVKPYLTYWFDLLFEESPRKPAAYRSAIAGFLRRHHYEGVIRLARKLGYTVASPVPLAAPSTAAALAGPTAGPAGLAAAPIEVAADLRISPELLLEKGQG